MSGAKVVGIHGAKVPESSGSLPLPAPLVKVREHGKEKLKDLLRALFNGADDALFSMADKAGSNAEQTLYFDAMRELRLEKKTLALETLREMIRSFNEVTLNTASKNLESNPDSDDLSLVQHEDVELKIAIEGMVSRVRGDSAESLEALNARIEHLITPLRLSADNVPMSPELLCRAFCGACDKLKIDIKAKLVVFKLFEKFVLSGMPDVYSEANSMLACQGVLSDLQVRKSAPSRAQDNSKASESSEDFDTNISRIQFDTLRSLLHPSGSNPQPAPLGGFVSGKEVISLLSSVQLSPTHDQLYDASKVVDFRKMISSKLTAGGDQRGCSEIESDVISLVEMLFEFILDDRQLQPQMKAIIGRLQIPILKVAILDSSFFSKGGHPARKLLNEMASAGLGWNEPREGRKDRLKDKLEEVSEKIINDFSDDVSMFSELLHDFQEFMAAELRRGLLVEQRTKDSENGKVATDLAKQAAQKVVNNSLVGAVLPPFAIELLKGAWSSVLVFHFLKDGHDGKAWELSCKFVDDFVWSMKPDPSQPEARSRLLKLIPSLVSRLRAGLSSIGYDDYKTKSLLTKLEDQHVVSLQVLQQQVSLGDAPPPITDETAVAEQDEAVAELIRSTMELESDLEALSEACESAETQPSDVTQSVASQSENSASMPEEFVAAEALVLVDEEQKQDEEFASDHAFMQQVDRFVVGCWFEFGAGETSERCKLAAIIKAADKFIFVNRSGIKVGQHTKQGLATLLSKGELQPLNDGLLFDRALESIITNLRSDKS